MCNSNKPFLLIFLIIYPINLKIKNQLLSVLWHLDKELFAKNLKVSILLLGLGNVITVKVMD